MVQSYTYCGHASKITKIKSSLFHSLIIFYGRFFTDILIAIRICGGKKSDQKISISQKRRMVQYRISCGHASKITKIKSSLFHAQIIFYGRFFTGILTAIQICGGKNSDDKYTIVVERLVVQWHLLESKAWFLCISWVASLGCTCQTHQVLYV